MGQQTIILTGTRCFCPSAAAHLLLEPLIGIVYAKLLEAVLLEALEDVNVQNAEGCLRPLLARRQCLVDLCSIIVNPLPI